jgi:DNA-binding CsgD family transcriptional regulator
VRGHPPVEEMLEVAASAVPLLERAQGLVDALDRFVCADAVWLAVSDPASTVYATVGSTGLDSSALSGLDHPRVAEEIQDAGLDRDRPPVSVSELPIAVEELPTWAECLIPAGFREGLAVPLSEPSGPYLGMLCLLSSTRGPAPAGLRTSMAQVAPVVASGVSSSRSLQHTANLVRGATSGVVLLRDGSAYPLPGLPDQERAARDRAVVRVARETLLAGRLHRSFLWPCLDAGGSTVHVRMTALAASDVPAFVLGTLLLAPAGDTRGLTARELVVLGLVVDGRSNQQIAHRLVITPRTVATHVEHILHKLQVPTRTMAAVIAEREGCYVPACLPDAAAPSPTPPARPQQADGHPRPGGSRRS